MVCIKWRRWYIDGDDNDIDDGLGDVIVAMMIIMIYIYDDSDDSIDGDKNGNLIYYSYKLDLFQNLQVALIVGLFFSVLVPSLRIAYGRLTQY